MTTFLVRRLAQAVLVLVAVSVLAFALIYLSGDPVRALVPADARQEDVDNIRHGFGLDQPVHVQYLLFLERAVQGDLGQSFKYRTNAMELVLQRLPQTLLLACTSILIATLVSIPLGVFAATRRGRLGDVFATGIALLSISTPAFWLGLLGILVFADALRNGLIPTVTVLGLQFGALLGGSVVVETVFAWPGLGWLLVQSINSRDLPLVRAIVLVISLFFIAINLAVDLLYSTLDPRIRHA